MFKVMAIEEKTKQALLCKKCNTEYICKDFAYGAYDMESADDSGDPIAICQFTFAGRCTIHCLASVIGKESDEAVLILGFAVLEFLRRCGFTEVTAEIPKDYAIRLGFRETDGIYTLDLTAGRACGGH